MVRLVDNKGQTTTLKGRLEVQLDFTYSGPDHGWGTVSSDSFDITDANVFCKFLGYPEAIKVYYKSHQYFGLAGYYKPVWMNDMKCVGTEKSPFSCPQSTISAHKKDHHNDVGISCKGK